MGKSTDRHPAIGRPDQVGDGEHRRRDPVARKHRERVAERVCKAVVERDRDSGFGPFGVSVEGVCDLVQRQQTSARLLQVAHLRFEALGRAAVSCLLRGLRLRDDVVHQDQNPIHRWPATSSPTSTTYI